MTFDELDLHTFRAAEVEAVVEEFIFEAGEKGLREVRIAHGKGRGHLRRRVHAVLARLPEVEAFGQDGPNWGATCVRLRVPR